MNTSLARIAGRLATVQAVFRNPQLRRLELAWGGFHVGEWAHFVALSIFAYDRGGAAAVGVLGLVRMLPAAVAMPFGAMLADRHRRERMLLAINLARAATLAGAALALAAEAQTWVVFALAALAAITVAPIRPTQLALVPLLARTPQELVAANVSSSTFEGIGTLGGPAVAAALLAVSSPASVLAVSAGIYLWCALLVSRIEHEAEPSRSARRLAAGALTDLLAGVRTLAKEPRPRLIISLFSAQTFVRGLLNVLLVVVALKLLGIGNAGFGLLTSALGAGGLVGALAALALVGRRRVANPFASSLVLWGAPIALIAAWPTTAWALVCLTVIGAANAILDVSGYTLIQRSIEDHVQARVFGVFEVLVQATIALGSAVGAILVAQLDVRGALLVTGAILPVLAIASLPRLRRVDATAEPPEPALQLISDVSLFAPLPVTTLERLAARALWVKAKARTEIIHQGDPGELFYVIVRGQVEVVHDGKRVATLQRRGYFGEIALLREVPRVATVRAVSDVELLALARESFVAAVSGHARSEDAAEDMMRARLAELEHLSASPS